MDAITQPPVIRLHPEDGVVIARQVLPPGTPVAPNVVAAVRIPAGHKVAVRAIAQGEPVRRYNQIIGFATRADRAGRARAHAQPAHGRLRARLRLRRRREADRAAWREPATFHGHPPGRWPRGDAQLHRHR